MAFPSRPLSSQPWDRNSEPRTRETMPGLPAPDFHGCPRPDIVYREFELVHPFSDGNGRTGKVLLNYLADTLERPTMPSDWFGCANP